MLGLSLGKILFTVLVIVAVWWGFRAVQRRLGQADRLSRRDAAERAAREAVRATMEKRGQRAVVEDLEQCPRCGTYVPKGARCTCEGGGR